MLCVIFVMFNVLSAIELLLMHISIPNVCYVVLSVMCCCCLDVAALINTVCPPVSLWLAAILSVCLF